MVKHSSKPSTSELELLKHGEIYIPEALVAEDVPAHGSERSGLEQCVSKA
jgi:hypothetical protein